MEKNNDLPHGPVIAIGNEKVCFIPQAHKLTHDSIMKCVVDIGRDLYTNTVSSGRTTIPLRKEMTAPASAKIKIVVLDVWIQKLF